MANENVPFTLHETDTPGKYSIVRMGPVAYLTAPQEIAELIVELMNANKAKADAVVSNTFGMPDAFINELERNYK